METKHTPGPWHYRKCPKDNDPIWEQRFPYWIDSHENVPIADVRGIGEPASYNAQLIAAAPDLLEACQYVVDWHREHDSGEGELFGLDFVTACICAIRKTTVED